jgi:two-component system, NarL family, response regulator DevR
VNESPEKPVLEQLASHVVLGRKLDCGITSMTAIRLLIVDDHPLLRAGLRTVHEMAPDIHLVGEAKDGAEALAAVRAMLPDVVLLDIRLQGESGIDVCRTLKAAAPSVRVLFLTSYADDQLILSALEAGADGYLLKESDTRRLVDAIREIARGELVFDPQVMRRLVNGRKSTRSDGFGTLSPQERRLLAEVAKGKTDKEVAAALGLSTKTARNYLDRIFTKLNVHTRTEAALLYTRLAERGR